MASAQRAVLRCDACNVANTLKELNMILVCERCKPLADEMLERLISTRATLTDVCVTKLVEELERVKNEISVEVRGTHDKLVERIDKTLEDNNNKKKKASASPPPPPPPPPPPAPMFYGNNILWIKSTLENNDKAAYRKKLLLSSVEPPVIDVRITKGGHLGVHFATTKHAEEAMEQLKSVSAQHNVSVIMQKKLKPKIKVVNVCRDDNTVVTSIKTKNPWLAELIVNEEEDFKLVKEIPSSRYYGFKHCIIKCSPGIRRAIKEKNDILALLYQTCYVTDSFHIYQCNNCQGFYHTSENCTKPPVCWKCAATHKGVYCTSSIQSYRCVNCISKNKLYINHAASDDSCPTYREELEKQRANTDYGV